MGEQRWGNLSNLSKVSANKFQTWNFIQNSFSIHWFFFFSPHQISKIKTSSGSGGFFFFSSFHTSLDESVQSQGAAGFLNFPVTCAALLPNKSILTTIPQPKLKSSVVLCNPQCSPPLSGFLSHLPPSQVFKVFKHKCQFRSTLN